MKPCAASSPAPSGELAQAFTEVSPADGDRPELPCALEVCRLTGMVLVIRQARPPLRDARVRLGWKSRG